jgi:peptidase M28-like protein
MGLAGLAALALWNRGDAPAWQRPSATKARKQSEIPFNGERAYGHLKELCAIGPRVSGSEGMRRQQALLKNHFEKLGGRVSLQDFTARHPQTGQPVKMANLIVQWHPERLERILLCAHYDTRPFPDQDPVDRRGIFLGANDGASGTALLCELGQAMPGLPSKYGVDFVLFDGEELVYDGNRDPYFLGSEYFAREYAANPPPHKYKWGVLLDMVGDAQLQIYRETNSLRTAEQRRVVGDIWSIARELGVREFSNGPGYEIRDDHLALNDIARIPTIDIIDFDYPSARGPSYWHTTQDVPEKCSPQSLAKVGWVLKTWLERLK